MPINPTTLFATTVEGTAYVKAGNRYMNQLECGMINLFKRPEPHVTPVEREIGNIMFSERHSMPNHVKEDQNLILKAMAQIC